MNRTSDATSIPLAEPEDTLFRLDRPVFNTVWQRRKKTFWRASVVLLLLSEAAFLLIFPRKYISTASLYIQQSSVAGLFSGALNTITKGKSGITSSYSGVVGSRKFAVAAIKAAKLDSLYTFEDEDDAVAFMGDAVDLVDQYDGLARIIVSLPGPPLYLDRGRANRIREASRIVADSYVASLQDFVANTDTDRDSALIHQATALVKQARLDYADSVRSLTDFLRQSHSAPVDVQAIGLVGATSGGPGLSQLQSLYLARADVETQIRAAEVGLRSTSALAASLSSPKNTLPGEDPLLIEARRRVSEEERILQTLRVTLADTNPDVVAAQRRLENARQNLAAEQRAVMKNRTSAAVDLDSLRARYGTLQNQIAEAEKTFRVSRNVATDLELRRNDVSLKLEVLKAAETNYAQLQVQAVAGDSRLDMVDAPLVPKKPKPGTVLLAISGFALTFLLMMVWLAVDYLKAVRQRPDASPSRSVSVSENGTGTVSEAASIGQEKRLL